MDKAPYLGTTLTRWEVGNSTFLAIPEKGARLMNWNLRLPDGSFRDIIYWPELSSLENFHGIRGGNPILFPFCGRTFDRGEIHLWRDRSGARRPMPMHGIARQGEFTLAKSDPAGFTAQFVPGSEAKAAYPFNYVFTVTYRFEPLGLSCELALQNLGAEPLPWSAGHHFYFAAPWTEGASRSDCLVRIPASKRFRQDFTSGLLEAGPALRPEENLSNPDLVDTIHTNLRVSEVVFGEKGRAGDIAVRWGTDPVPPPDATFVTWAPEDAPCYCVEPWMGPPNAPENRIGLHFVPPGATRTFTVSVHVR